VWDETGWFFREHGLPVIRVYHTDLKWGPAPDSDGFQFLPSIMAQDEDPKIVKNYPNAFKKTELETLLREKGCNTVFLCGLSSTGCVLATYHGAPGVSSQGPAVRATRSPTS
jgi:nicotinamidase-related amidase